MSTTKHERAGKAMGTPPEEQSSAAPSPVTMSRRAFSLAGACATLLGSTAAVEAQSGNWWDNIFGSAPAPTSPRPRTERAAEALNDLRPDKTPMRSDVMVSQMERAIGLQSQIVSRGGWPTIPGTRSIRPADDDERMPLLRRRLVASGDLSARAAGNNSYAFDGELEAAVRRFQDRHGLRSWGRVDAATIAALNVSAQNRLNQLRLNLQRLNELMAQRVEDKYVLVNAPSYQLEAVERHTVELRHRVIVGRLGRETPAVRATIRALNFFPYWRVPDSVATLDLFPRLQKEPEYLRKEMIRVLSGSYTGPEVDPQTIDWRQAEATKIKFRQDPGPQNALGLVRIDMPNEHGVYMHDTPMKKLFEQRGRAFSAGCVRVQDVFQLVQWIGRDEAGFDRTKMDEVLAAGIGYDVVLTRQVPVYFTYITAWAEADGHIEFRPDLYGRDGQQELAAGRERDPNEPPPGPLTLAP